MIVSIFVRIRGDSSLKFTLIANPVVVWRESKLFMAEDPWEDVFGVSIDNRRTAVRAGFRHSLPNTTFPSPSNFAVLPSPLNSSLISGSETDVAGIHKYFTRTIRNYIPSNFENTTKIYKHKSMNKLNYLRKSSSKSSVG